MTVLAHKFYGARPEPGQRTLVLLHAYPLSSSMWDRAVEYLHETDPTVPVIAIDAPGFGASPSGEEIAEQLGRLDEPSLDTVAEAVEATLEKLGIDDVVMVGLSLGGYTALAYAERYPARLRALGLFDTKAEADEEPARKVRIQTAARVLAEGAEAIVSLLKLALGKTTQAKSPEIEEALREDVLAAAPAAIAWIQHAMAARPDRLHVLRSLNIPVLVLRGDEDELSSAQSAEAMVEAASEGNDHAVKLVTLPRVGHMAANEAPREVAQALADIYRA